MHAVKDRRLIRISVALATAFLVLAGLGQAAEQTAQHVAQQPAAEAEPPAAETPWPYEVKDGSTVITVYQPQLDSWDGVSLKARAAVAVTTEGSKQGPTYGIVHVTAATLVDKGERIVTLDRLHIEKSEFPSAKGNSSDAWVSALQRDIQSKTRTLALDRLEANLKIVQIQEEKKGDLLKNSPPEIIFSKEPAMLVYVDGMPAYRPLSGTSYQRLINTRALIVKTSAGRHFLHLFDGWMTSESLLGVWSVASNPPPELKKIEDEAIESRQVDMLTGQSDPEQPAPSLAQGPVPHIYIASTTTELIVTDGEPNWVPIPGTQLLFVQNTTGHVFKLLGDQKTYLLVSGRWFRSIDMTKWEFVPADMLAGDFSRIPDDSPKENVKASVSGTPQAKDAAIAASIPTTAAVNKSEAQMTPPQFDGEPKLVAIHGTALQYVVNTATPIVMVSANSYYAVENGVWFTANSLQGPWTIATSVPAEVYKIPASCPIHYVTYVKVYDVHDDTVYVGYTSGYKGETVDPVTHVVVYGTGYYYTPWVGSVWYGPPVTYGFGVALRYTPWTGWTVGYGFGWSWGAATVAIGWGWGAYPWWGPYGWGWSWGPPYYPIYPAPYWGVAAGPGGAVAWGPGGWAGTTGNMYHRWDNTATVSRISGGYNAWTGNRWASHVGMSYNSSTGVLAAGQRGAVANVYTGNYATGGRGVAIGPGGITVAGKGGTAGNIYTGGQVTAGKGVIYNENTGNVTQIGGIKGDDAAALRVGDDVYAGKDGNVYKRTEGGWEQVTPPNRVEPRDYSSDKYSRDLNQQHYSRDLGAQRSYMNSGASRSMNRSFGGGRRR